MKAPLWERLEAETAQAFEAFIIYRDDGSGRSQKKVAEKLNKSETLMARWSTRHRWIERVSAFDAHQGRIISNRLVAGRANMAERHVTLAEHLLNKSAQRILSMTDQEVNALSPYELARIIDLATKLEDRARGTEEDVLPEIQFKTTINAFMTADEIKKKLADQKIPEPPSLTQVLAQAMPA